MAENKLINKLDELVECGNIKDYSVNWDTELHGEELCLHFHDGKAFKLIALCGGSSGEACLILNDYNNDNKETTV